MQRDAGWGDVWARWIRLFPCLQTTKAIPAIHLQTLGQLLPACRQVLARRDQQGGFSLRHGCALWLRKVAVKLAFLPLRKRQIKASNGDENIRVLPDQG